MTSECRDWAETAHALYAVFNQGGAEFQIGEEILRISTAAQRVLAELMPGAISHQLRGKLQLICSMGCDAHKVLGVDPR